MKKKLYLCACILFLCAPFLIQSQENLPNGYRTIRLGMTIDEVKESLKNDGLFNYRGDRDVSLLPTENRTLIETSSDTWLERCWFQFHNDVLYTIIINFNEELIDYFSVYNQLLEKYGMHKSLSPECVVWEDQNITLSLEKPVSVKYIDRTLYNKLKNESKVQQTIIENTREDILGGL